MDLFSSVSALSGVGPARVKALGKIGIRTLYDLISYFPRTYEDRTKIVRICELEDGVPACVEATVVTEPHTAHIRAGLDITKLTVADPSGRLRLVFFNQPYLKDTLHYGEDYTFFGQLSADFPGQMQNPSFDPADAAGRQTMRILPVYPLTAGISNKQMSRWVGQALGACRNELPELLPAAVRAEQALTDAATAYREIHEPTSFEALAEAKRRLVFEEFFIFSAGLALMRSRRKIQAVEKWAHTDPTPLYSALPYRLTGAQTRAIGDICGDLTCGRPMNRIVQGDVGSGKTIVAAAAAYLAAKNGRQSAMMAPTEILAEQHQKTLSALLGPFGMDVVLLTGSLKASEKKWIKERIASGHADLVIGTHALLSEDVTFAKLGLIIADEQHRFGVSQRAALAAKAESPHMLFMSATPIPRTLGLILYGDLDVSVMDELPPGRQTIDTFLVDETMRKRINAFIRRQVENGNQVYIVCPAVEENEELEMKAAEVWADALGKTVFPDLRVGLLHGKMAGREKDRVMRAFAAHEMDILVATTVIEVGVDVPNATLMVIEDAERFGLSQLHQLRGRVGRGRDKSYCVLMSSSKSGDAIARMKALCASCDGFKIAEEDLILRGPGDFFGNRQHGLPQFKVANLQMDIETLHQAQEAAKILSCEKIEHDPEYAPLLGRIRALFASDDGTFN